MKVVVGLGNPGRRYDQTRHNLGFDVVAELERRHPGASRQSGFESIYTEIRSGAEAVLLVCPQTYMNLSGRTVHQIARFYRVEPASFLVVCDDLNLDAGQLRMRAGGSDGGQKGLRNIISQLGTQEVPRLRIGIGRPPASVNASDYVLGKLTISERQLFESAVIKAADAVESWLRDGIDRAMAAANAKSPSPRDS